MFSSFIPRNTIQKTLDEEDLDLMIDEIVNGRYFEKSRTEIETYESKEEKIYPKEFDSEFPFAIIPDDLNENQMNDPRTEAMFKRSRHSSFSIFLISRYCYNLPERTTRAGVNIHLFFRTNFFRDVQNLFQVKSSKGFAFNDYKP